VPKRGQVTEGGENSITRSLVMSVFIRCCWDVQIKKNEMGKTCSMCKRDEKCVIHIAVYYIYITII
jgi:hypothetical protein